MKNTANEKETWKADPLAEEAAITVRDIGTTIKPFRTGQCAFNWARKLDADQVTVFVAGRSRATAMTIRKVGDGYTGPCYKSETGKWTVAYHRRDVPDATSNC